MKIDFPTFLGIVSVFILCIFAITIPVFVNDSHSDNVIDLQSIKTEQYAEILSEINQQATIYQNNGDSEQLTQHMNLMQQKQKEIASKILGVNIYEAYVAEGWNFPFREPSKVTISIPELEKPVCGIPEKIPSHLQLISHSEMFQMFIGKYFQYDLTLDISDERNHGWIHYNLGATSDDGLFYTSTYFHFDSCTDEMQGSYVLLCKDIKNDKHVSTRIKSEITSTLANDKFCNISLEPWHQGIRDYQTKISNQLEKHSLEKVTIDSERDSSHQFHLEFKRLGLLLDIARYYDSDVLETKKLQKDLAEYERNYGNLPDELLELMEMRK